MQSYFQLNLKPKTRSSALKGDHTRNTEKTIV